jgi:hypothetical protein
LKNRTEVDKAITEIVGAIHDPIIVMPNGWGDTLPKELKDRISLDRLIANMIGLQTGNMTATDAEACAYLYTASLEAPMDHDWAQIYLYVSTRFLESSRRHLGDEGKVSEDIRVTEITKYQQDKLDHLKRWIYERRVKHRKDRAHSEEKEQIQESKKAELETVQMGFDLGIK